MTKQEFKRDLKDFVNGRGTMNLTEIRKYRGKSKDWVRDLVKDLKPAEQSSAGLLRLDTNISRRYYIYFFGAKHLGIRFVDYSMIVATLPEPTVLPPSRIAKRRPCSIATG